MPKIEFVTHKYEVKIAEVPEGGALVDICDEVLAPVPFSCRSATCGTCHLQVLEGEEFLEAPREEEQVLLELLDGPGVCRLACQARVKPGAGLLKLRPLGE